MADTTTPAGQSPLPFVPPLVTPLRAPQRPALLRDVQAGMAELTTASIHARAGAATVTDAVIAVELCSGGSKARAHRTSQAVDLASAAQTLAELVEARGNLLEVKITAGAELVAAVVDEAAIAMRNMLQEVEVLGCSPMAAEGLKRWLARHAPDMARGMVRGQTGGSTTGRGARHV
jgi:hypothetical protein